MKLLFQKIIMLRNPAFHFDESLSTSELLKFSWRQLLNLARGLRLVLVFKNPRAILLGKNVTFFNIAKIRWGRFVKLEDHVCMSALSKDGILLGDYVSIGASSRIIVSTSFNHIGRFIRIGNNVGIGEFAYLGGAGGLTIGAHTIIGQYFSCHPENHTYDNTEMLIRHQGVTRKGIHIGENCWIGSKVTILDGVQIGNGCVIAAGSVVTKSFPNNCVIGGVPAKLLKTRSN
jgi:acetyltransferase-like isoleucine patch superfamily enzyme